jgi:hypothetical protein
MSKPLYLIKDLADFERINHHVNQVFDVGVSFLDQPFRADVGEFFLFPYEFVAGERFWPTLVDLAELHSDSEIEVMVLSPDPIEYFYREFEYYSAFVISTESASADYWAALSEGPPGWEADALAYRAERWVIVGPSASWGIWNDRAYGLSVVCSRPDPRLENWVRSVSNRVLSGADAEKTLKLEIVDPARQAKTLRRFREIYGREIGPHSV